MLPQQETVPEARSAQVNSLPASILFAPSLPLKFVTMATPATVEADVPRARVAVFVGDAEDPRSEVTHDREVRCALREAPPSRRKLRRPGPTPSCRAAM